jgi:hypothetical protein
VLVFLVARRCVLSYLLFVESIVFFFCFWCSSFNSCGCNRCCVLAMSSVCHCRSPLFASASDPVAFVDSVSRSARFGCLRLLMRRPKMSSVLLSFLVSRRHAALLGA